MTDEIKNIVNKAYQLVGIANENSVPDLETIRACISSALNGRDVPTSQQILLVLKEENLVVRDGKISGNSSLKEVW